ncbi:MAG: ABC transporter ATP-binding protein [Deltaproteobacteria bacterium]|jgi:ABC-type branched-subunit amino acid transport system ATPase component|nr:ABC transporter ATP-binding protein [Deltaproteobacteria bacterium]
MSLFSIQGLTKRFGSLAATNGVSVEIEREGILSIIGPNGAGKTTFFNLVTGLLKPDAGKIIYQGKDITGQKPYEIIRHGLSRSFQVVSLFEELSVLDNVRVGVQRNLGFMNRLFLNYRRAAEVTERAMEILDLIGLADQADQPAAAIPHGDRKILDLGLALTTKPQSLLLDEPMAGLSKAERTRITQLIKELSLTHKIIVVEHDMDVVFGISDFILVLHHGSVLALGEPKDIAANEEVQSAYLGLEVH